MHAQVCTCQPNCSLHGSNKSVLYYTLLQGMLSMLFYFCLCYFTCVCNFILFFFYSTYLCSFIYIHDIYVLLFVSLFYAHRKIRDIPGESCYQRKSADTDIYFLHFNSKAEINLNTDCIQPVFYLISYE